MRHRVNSSFKKSHFTMLSFKLPHRIFTMTIAYDVITAITTATMAGNEFAVAAFVHPQLKRLGDRRHAHAASLLARILGKRMPLWYFISLLLMMGALFQHRPITSGPSLLILLAVVLWAIVIATTIAMLVPINNRIARLNPEHPYTSWRDDRARWDRLHRIRVALLLVSVGLLLTGLFQDRTTPCL
jgi:uncharacterized membrane protein